MEKKTKLITKILLGSAILISSGLLIFESVAPSNISPVYKMTHHTRRLDHANKELKNIRVHNDNVTVTPDNKIREISYSLDSPYTLDREVEITSSNPELIEIVGEGYRVINNSPAFLEHTQPVEIKVSSKSNPDIYDSFRIRVTSVPVDDINVSVKGTGLELESPNTDTRIFNASVNKLLEVSFDGISYTSMYEPSETIEIETSPNITKLDDTHYYINKNDGKDCYIKAFAGSSISKTVAFNVDDGSTQPKASNWQVHYGDSSEPIRNDKITAYSVYTIKPYLNNQYYSELPFKISSPDEFVHITGYNSFFVDKVSEFQINIEPINQTTLNAKYYSDLANIVYDMKKIGDRNEISNTLVTYENSGFDIKMNPVNISDDFNFEVEDPSLISYKNGHFVALKQGETKIKITHNLLGGDWETTVDVIVKPEYQNVVFNENIIFGFWHLGLGLMIAIFVFLFIMNKKYLPLQPIAYGVSLLVVSLLSVIELASPFRVITFALFALNLLLEFVGITIFYIGIIFYHKDNGYSLDINEYVPLDHDKDDQEKDKKEN